jgi:predicted CoA-binding protein
MSLSISTIDVYVCNHSFSQSIDQFLQRRLKRIWLQKDLFVKKCIEHSFSDEIHRMRKISVV